MTEHELTLHFLMQSADQHQSVVGTHHSDSDDYSDDDDPGYTRQDIQGQEAFISRELDLSDDEGSHRGPLSFQSPSPLIKPSSSNGQASSYMAEPPGTSVQDSEAPSDLSHSTIHQPDRSSSNAAQPFNLTLRPDPNILGTSDVNANAEAVQDTSRTDHSSASSASLTGTDKSRDVAGEAPASELASNAGAEAPSEGQIQASIVHQTSGIRYLLDGVLEKVSDAFSRHQPQGTPRPSHTSDTSGDQDEYAEQDRNDNDGTRVPGRNSYSEGARHVAWAQTAQLYMPRLQSASHTCVYSWHVHCCHEPLHS